MLPARVKALALLLFVAAEGVVSLPAVPLAEFVGLQHFQPCYGVNQTLPSLLDGAAQAHRIGTRTFKFALADTTPTMYPFNNEAMPWPAGVDSLVAMAATPQVAALLGNQAGGGTNFTTFVMWAYRITGGGNDGGYWCSTFSEEDASAETHQFAELTEYLLTTYEGTGLTFVLEHWEGDWAARCGSYDPDQPPKAAVIANMIRWLQARQIGVQQGRAAYSLRSKASFRGGLSGPATVHHGTEVNLVYSCITNLTCGNLARAVIPFVALDTVSYSSYETMSQPTLGAALDFIYHQMNRTADSPIRPVFITEWGLPLMQVSTDVAAATAHNVLYIAASKPFVSRTIHWQVINNELLDASPEHRALRSTNALCDGKAQVTDPTKQRGFWAVRPDGSLSFFGAYFQGVLNGSIPYPPADGK